MSVPVWCRIRNHPMGSVEDKFRPRDVLAENTMAVAKKMERSVARPVWYQVSRNILDEIQSRNNNDQ